jgi:hypothetical protein
MTTLFIKYALTGGADNALDSIPDYTLTSAHFAFVAIPAPSLTLYSYRYDPTSVADESVPYVIKPDISNGDGRWILKPFSGGGGPQ